MNDAGVSYLSEKKTKERPMGVEPTTGAWEATVLPLHYGRVSLRKRP